MTQPAKSRFNRFISYTTNKLWLTFATLIILLALVFSLLRLSLPQINYFKADIEAWVENNFQVEIAFESIDAKWQGAGPSFTINQLQLKSTDGKFNLLSIENISVHFDVFQSLITKSLVTENIQISGANLNFILGRKLEVRLDVLEDVDSRSLDVEKTSQLLLSSLFAQKHLSLANSNITLETMAGKAFRYEIENLFIRNYGEIHQLSGILLDAKKGQLELVAEIHGDPSLSNSQTDLFLAGKGMDIAEFPLLASLKSVKPSAGQLNWRLWGNWNEGRWQTAVGDFSAEYVLWDAASQDPQTHKLKELAIDTMQGQFNWYFHQQNTGVLSLNQVTIKPHSKDAINLPELHLLFSQNEAFDLRWDIVTQDWQMDTVGAWLDPLITESSVISQTEAVAQSTIKSDLKLKINYLGARFARENGVWQPPKAIVNFSNLAFQNIANLPKVSGLSGELGLDGNLGFARLTAEQGSIEFPNLFRDQIEIGVLEVSLDWLLRADETLDLNIISAKLSNSDLSLVSRGHFFFQQQTPILSLYSEIYEANAANKSLYLPSGIMSDALVNYLDTGVKSGNLSYVKSVVHGPIREFPFVDSQGLFAVNAQLENSRFEFLTDWPVVDNINAELAFEGNSMAINVTNAISLNNQLTKGKVKISDFAASEIILGLDLTVESRDNLGRDYLVKTPLSSIAESLQVIDYKGPVKTQLNASINLADERDQFLEGKVTPQPKSAKLNVVGMSFEDLNGSVLFDQNGIKKSQLTASYYGSPLKATLRAGKNSEQAELSIDAQGQFDAKSIKDFVGEPWVKFAAGRSAFEATIDIGLPENKNLTKMIFQTDLKGISINLPDQLAKKADVSQPLKVEVLVGDVSHAKVLWENLNGQWQWREKKMAANNGINQTIAGAFNYGTDADADTDTDIATDIDPDVEFAKLIDGQFVVNGKLKQINLASWGPVVNAFNEAQESSDSEINADLKINLDIAEIQSESIDLLDLNLVAEKKIQQDWRVLLSNQQMIVNLRPLPNQPWELDIPQLKLTYKPEYLAHLQLLKEQEKTAGLDERKNIVSTEQSALADDNAEIEHDKHSMQQQSDNYFASISSWRDLDIHCTSCDIFGHQFGTINAKLRTAQNKLNLSGKIVKKDTHNLAFDLLWRQPQNSKANIMNIALESEIQSQSEFQQTDHTQLKFELNSQDLGRLLASWDYPVDIKQSSGDVVAEMSWFDLPWEIEPKKMQANANFKLGEGYLSELSDAKARIFSLFNLSSLGKRLSLDFKDVFGKGFFYKSITGDVNLQKGLVTTKNIFIDGNAASVALGGVIDLNDRTIEHSALVTPHLTSSLPVLVGWAVNPATGVLAYLINKIMEPAIEVVSQIEYRIHGSLEQIQVEEVNKVKSKVQVEVSEEPVSESDTKSQQVQAEHQKEATQ